MRSSVRRSPLYCYYIQNRKNVGNASGLGAPFSFRCAAQKRHGGWGKNYVRRDYVPPAHSAKYVIYRNLLRLMSGKSPAYLAEFSAVAPATRQSGTRTASRAPPRVVHFAAAPHPTAAYMRATRRPLLLFYFLSFLIFFYLIRISHSAECVNAQNGHFLGKSVRFIRLKGAGLSFSLSHLV